MSLDCIKIPKHSQDLFYICFRPEFINSREQIYDNGFDYNSLLVLSKHLELPIEKISDIKDCLLDFVSPREKVVYLLLSSETKSIFVALENGCPEPK